MDDLITKRVVIVIPTYNEAENITLLIEQLFSVNANFSVLIIDDNSPDGTSQEVKKLQDKYFNLHLITRKYRLGLGSAYRDGFKYVLERDYDVVIQMDADLSHSPGYILKMVDSLNDYDLVVGSRYIKNGGIADWALGRIMLSRLANLYSKILLGVPINDLTSGFKCMRRSVVVNIDYDIILSRGYAFQIELIFCAALRKFKILEYPIVFKGRRNDKSKMSLGMVSEAFFRVIVLSFKKYLK